MFPPAESVPGGLVVPQSPAVQLLNLFSTPDVHNSLNQATVRSHDLKVAFAEHGLGLDVRLREVVPLAFGTQALPLGGVYVLQSPVGYVPVIVVAASEVLVTALQPDGSTAIYHRDVFLQEWTGILLELADTWEGGA